MKIYSFVRCMTTGEVYLLGGSEIEFDAIEEGGRRYRCVGRIRQRANGPKSNPHGVKLSGFCLHYTNEVVEINTIQVLESPFENREVHLRLHFTLTVGHEDRKQEWLVHLQRAHSKTPLD